MKLPTKCETILCLKNNGDIVINQFVSNRYRGVSKEVYHKTYNPNENLQDNLIEAYNKWEEIRFKKEVDL